MTSHVIAYRSLVLLFGMHTFNFNCFFDDFNCVFTQIRYLSRVLPKNTNRRGEQTTKVMTSWLKFTNLSTNLSSVRSNAFTLSIVNSLHAG